MAESTLTIIINAKDNASRKLKGLKTSFGGLGTALKIGVAGGAIAGAAGLIGLTKVMRSSVQAASVQQAADSQLAAVLKSTGGAAGLSAKELKGLAAQLQGTTKFGDEAIETGESLLLTFTNIGKDVFPDATQTMLDMSQALGQDMKSSAIQLGKALNDPIAGVTALQRVGVSFTDTQKDQIKAMVEAGDTMGAQKLILAELSKEFGGSAQAAAETYDGRMAQLHNSIGDLKETIGSAFIPVLTDLAVSALPMVTEATAKLAAWLGENLPTMIAATRKAWETQLKPALVALWKFTREDVIPVLKILGGWLKTHIPEGMAAVKLFWDTKLGPALNMLWRFTRDKVLPVLVALTNWLKDHLPGAMRTVRGVWDTVLRPAFDGIKRFADDAWRKVKALIDKLNDFKNLLGSLPSIPVLGHLGEVRHALPQYIAPSSPYIPSPYSTPSTPRAATPFHSMGGGGMQFVYAPVVSAATQREVEQVLRPALDKWYQGARRRRV